MYVYVSVCKNKFYKCEARQCKVNAAICKYSRCSVVVVVLISESQPSADFAINACTHTHTHLPRSTLRSARFSTFVWFENLTYGQHRLRLMLNRKEIINNNIHMYICMCVCLCVCLSVYVFIIDAQIRIINMRIFAADFDKATSSLINT